MSERPDETTAESSGRNLIPQPHGGALRRGGNGSGGRPPSKVRRAMLKQGANRLRVLREIADNPKEKARDRIRAVDVLIKNGLGPAISMDEVRDKLKATKDAAEEILPPELAETFVKELRRIWLGE